MKILMEEVATHDGHCCIYRMCLSQEQLMYFQSTTVEDFLTNEMKSSLFYIASNVTRSDVVYNDDTFFQYKRYVGFTASCTYLYLF